MPRQPRPTDRDTIYNICARGNRRQRIYLSDRDFLRFLGQYDDVFERLGWQTYAWCLMPNHYHFLLRTPEDDISIGMHRLNGIYAQWFNLTHGFDGHLFQDRFYSRIVETDWHLLELCRYIVLNPVRAGLCASPEVWPWSSYAATIGKAQRPRFLALDELMTHFGGGPTARTVCVDFVHEGLQRIRLRRAA